MTKPTVLLLSGWAGSGKDAAAALLVEELHFERFAFADALKEDVSRKTGLALEVFHESCYKDKPILGKATPRDLLLKHALFARASDPDIYSRAVVNQILESPSKRIVISDWRYTREYDVLQNALGEDVQLLRGRVIRPSVTPSTDPSEHDLDDEGFDFIIPNDGCISDLRDALKTFVRQAL